MTNVHNAVLRNSFNLGCFGDFSKIIILIVVNTTIVETVQTMMYSTIPYAFNGGGMGAANKRRTPKKVNITAQILIRHERSFESIGGGTSFCSFLSIVILLC